MKWLDELNEQQRVAATAGDGPVLIVAGPGTGKTKTLTARIAYLVTSGLAKPEHILALTFTKKAAEEMRSRVESLLESAGAAAAGRPYISTFHALCHELLGGEAAFVAEAERLRIIKQLSRPAAFKNVTVRELALRISRYKNQAEDDPALADLTIAYDAVLAERNMCDFDDLLLKVKRSLTDDATQRAAVQSRYKYVLVDEFQDTNMLQYDLLRLLLGHDNLFVIGDPNQSIYGFRGADSSIFTTFVADYPACVHVTLADNYRSTIPVVAVGNAVVADGPQLRAHADTPGTVQTVTVLNEYSEANWVLDTIQRAVGGGDFLHAVSDNHREDERSLKDFAVLYRNRSTAVAFQKAIAASGLPYQVVGEGSPYDQPQVQTILTVLRAGADPAVPVPEAFTAHEWQIVIDDVRAHASNTPQAAAEHCMALLGIAPTPALHQVIGGLVRFPTVVAAIQHIDALADTGFYDPSVEAVTLLTIHASKGLEFNHVFLLGVEQGLLPYDGALLAEERRLFYVAVTRARHSLEIMHARSRGGKPVTASSFITALPATTVQRVTDPHMEADKRRAQKRAAKRSQQSLF